MEKIHLITVIYNFAENKSRYTLTNNFIETYKLHPQIELYIVELTYMNKNPKIVDINNKNHLHVKSNTPLWHKENLINLAVEKLIPKTCEYIAWIDGNIEFKNNDFVDKIFESLKIYDFIQIFSKCERNDIALKESFGKKINDMIKNNTRPNFISDFGHTGYGFATKKSAFNKIFPLPDKFIVGGGDSFFCFGFVGLNFYDYAVKSQIDNINIKKYADEHIEKIKGLKIGYADNEIIYYEHGDVKNRKYTERWKILDNYNPYTDIKYNDDGVIEFIGNKKIQNDVLMYFYDRKEDEK